VCREKLKKFALVDAKRLFGTTLVELALNCHKIDLFSAKLQGLAIKAQVL